MLQPALGPEHLPQPSGLKQGSLDLEALQAQR